MVATKPAVTTLIAFLAIAGICYSGAGIYVFAKAELAQYLLQHAWRQTIETGNRVAPWPWADTHPIASLRVPTLDIEQIVLAGASGRTLAFGPAHASGSFRPGAVGMSIIAGHRDTHFSFLRKLSPGTAVEVRTADNSIHQYRVSFVEVIDTRRPTGFDLSLHSLALLTCYPFDAVVPGGPLRYLVLAEPVAAPEPAAASL